MIMKTSRILKVVPPALVMSWLLTEASLAQVPRLHIEANLKSEPLVLNGISGGAVSSTCGNISNTPNQIIHLTKPLPYLRLTVDGSGQPTLLIDGPGGRFCVLADNYSESKPELAGYFMPGEYLLYVGQLSPGQHDYNLLISQQKKPIK